MTIGRLFYPFQSGHSLPWPLEGWAVDEDGWEDG